MDKSIINDKIGKLVKSINDHIVIIKGGGGFRYRAKFQLSDVEFDKIYAEAVSKIHILGIGIIVAEEMLREPPPSFHSRWDEYKKRVSESIKEWAEKKS